MLKKENQTFLFDSASIPLCSSANEPALSYAPTGTKQMKPRTSKRNVNGLWREEGFAEDRPF